MRRARTEGKKVSDAIAASGGKWCVSIVDLDDETESVIACAEAIRKTLDGTGFLLISAGVKYLTIVLNISENFYDKINGLEFFEESLKEITAVKVLKRDESILHYYCLSSVITISNPSQFKAVVQASATEYLKKQGLLN